jgi:hypothetical protein
MKVEEVMTREVEFCTPETNLAAGRNANVGS